MNDWRMNFKGNRLFVYRYNSLRRHWLACVINKLLRNAWRHWSCGQPAAGRCSNPNLLILLDAIIYYTILSRNIATLSWIFSTEADDCTWTLVFVSFDHRRRWIPSVKCGRLWITDYMCGPHTTFGLMMSQERTILLIVRCKSRRGNSRFLDRDSIYCDLFYMMMMMMMHTEIFGSYIGCLGSFVLSECFVSSACGTWCSHLQLLWGNVLWWLPYRKDTPLDLYHCDCLLQDYHRSQSGWSYHRTTGMDTARRPRNPEET